MDGHPGESVSPPGSEAAEGGAETPSELGELFLPGAAG